jgi:deoxyadenosine/deoxycytidine kinase
MDLEVKEEWEQWLQPKPYFFGLDGLIGSGKSTALKELCNHLNLRAFYEPVEKNPFLQDYYKDPIKHFMDLQHFFLSSRACIQELAALELFYIDSPFNGSGVDRLIIMDAAFVVMGYKRNYISKKQYLGYMYEFNVLSCSFSPPYKIIYLVTTPEVALERCIKRARGEEIGLDLQYMKDLLFGYEYMFDLLESGKHPWSRGSEIIRLDWNTPNLSIVKELKKLEIIP